MHAVCDPRWYSSVVRNKQLLFSEIGKHIQTVVFTQSPLSVSSEEFDRETHAQYVRYLGGRGLDDLTTATFKSLRRWMRLNKATQPAHGWRTVDLYELVADVMMESSIRTLFGSAIAADSAELQRLSSAMDHEFFRLYAGVPRLLMRRGAAARDQLVARCFSDTANAEEAKIVTIRRELCRSHPELYSRHDEAAFQAALLYASVTNTIPAAFWALTFLLHHPRALNDVREEMERVLPPVKPLEDRDEDELATIISEQCAELAVTRSAIEESLRLTINPLPTRLAMTDTSITSLDGRQVSIRKGDTVCIISALTHVDERIFAHPYSFEHDRFLSPEPLTLEGHKVPQALMPFGAGLSLCPGRHWVRNEILLLVALLLTHCEIELEDGSRELPEMDYSRMGVFGAKSAVRVRYRYKH